MEGRGRERERKKGAKRGGGEGDCGDWVCEEREEKDMSDAGGRRDERSAD